MNIDKLFLERRSVRSFSDKPIDKKIVLELLNAARMAPSAVNYQPWRFFVCTSDEIKQRIVDSYPRNWFKSAPLYIVACADKSQSWKRPSDEKDHGTIDVAIAVTHLMLKATERGLGTCWVCNFDAAILKEALNLDKVLEPVAIIPLGYPDPSKINTKAEKNRKSVSEFTEWI